MNNIMLIQSLKLFISKITSFMSDESFCKVIYFIKNRRFIDLNNPQSFSEKLYWLKLYGGLERYYNFADKFSVRSFVETTIKDEILVPLVAVYESSADLSFSTLPDRFVLKLNSASGYNLIVTDKNKFTEESLRKIVDRWLKVDFYLITRERQYKPIKNRVIVEHFLEFEPNKALLDYKVYCFNGTPHMIQVISERSGFSQQHTYYDINWNQLKLHRKEYPPGEPVRKPLLLDKMLHYAELLACDFSFSRIDFYIVSGRIFFGEITFIPANANLTFLPVEDDKRLASMIRI